MHATDKIFGKIFLKVIRDTFLANMWSVVRRGMGDSIFEWGWYPTEGENSRFWSCRETLPILPLVGHLDLFIRKILIKVVGLLTVIILKRVSESIFIESSKFTACKVKNEKEVTNSLIVFNLLKIIHPFQGKKHLRT